MLQTNHYSFKPVRVRRSGTIISNLLTLTLATVFAAAADDTQIIQSSGFVLSIYSYGAAGKSRISPEEIAATRRERATGALTDVISTPPLSGSVPLRSTNEITSTTSGRTADESAASFITSPIPSNGSAQTAAVSGSEVSLPTTVTVSWDRSPGESVVGYELYIGDASHQYTSKQPIGDQTSAQLVVGEGTIYVAVSAYAADGLESPLSEELVVPGNNGQSESAAAGSGIASETR